MGVGGSGCYRTRSTLSTWAPTPLQIVVGKQQSSAAAAAAAAGAVQASPEDPRAPGEFPASLDGFITVDRATVRGLQARTGELVEELKALRGRFEALHEEVRSVGGRGSGAPAIPRSPLTPAQERTLAAAKKTLTASIQAQRTACDELMILKFGRLVDIDLLDKAAVSAAAAAASSASGGGGGGALAATTASLSYSLSPEDSHAQAAELQAANAAIANASADLLAVTRAHTAALESIAVLTAKVRRRRCRPGCCRWVGGRED